MNVMDAPLRRFKNKITATYSLKFYSTGSFRFKRFFSSLVFIIIALPTTAFAEALCVSDNQWLIPESGKSVTPVAYLPIIASQNMLLLGEHHSNVAHHQWQLSVLQDLKNQNNSLVIGLEMFPRHIQPVLDEWIAGKLSSIEFIKKSQWNEIWAYDFDQYLPLFEFARDNRIPMVAINISKSLLQMVRQVGWENIPEQHRENVDNPAKPLKRYVRQLAVSFQGHFSDPSKINKIAFLRFVQQQLLWDRAMARALHETSLKFPGKQVVGIVGSWHIIDRQGIPHQLSDLGIDNVLTLVPWDEHLDCDSISPKFADAIFGTPAAVNLSISADQ